MVEVRMKLYELWQDGCGYDEMDDLVVRAKSSKDARKFAAREAAAEGPEVWLDPEKSYCERLREDGEEGIVLRNVIKEVP